MNRRPVFIEVTDHAIVRWLERVGGLDVASLRQHLAAHAINGAELGASAVHLGKVKLILEDTVVTTAGVSVVNIVTTAPRLYARKAS